MSKWDQYADRFDQLRQLWDEAEENVKLAEQVSERVALPAIKELRYGGRRVIEIINNIATEADDNDIQNLFADAEFDCIRSRHDAIDAIVSKISLDLNAARRTVGYSVILKTFPELPKTINALSKAKQKIAESRKDRDNRPAIYRVVETVDVPMIVDFYGQFQASEKMMIQLAKQERRTKFWSLVFGACGIIALIFTVVGAYTE